MTCLRCPATRIKARGLCSPCYMRAYHSGDLVDFERTKRPWVELVEDLELLLDGRTSPHQAARALAMNPQAIANAAHRHGRDDLARPFWAYVRREQRAKAS